MVMFECHRLALWQHRKQDNRIRSYKREISPLQQGTKTKTVLSLTYKSILMMCTHTHTHMLQPFLINKLHSSLFNPRGHSTSWPVGQQAVVLISEKPPLSRERHMVNSTVISQQITTAVTSQQRLCSGIINFFVTTSASGIHRVDFSVPETDLLFHQSTWGQTKWNFTKLQSAICTIKFFVCPLLCLAQCRLILVMFSLLSKSKNRCF